MLPQIRSATLLAGLALGCSGCFGPFFEHIRIDPTSVDRLRQDIPTYRAADVKPDSYRVVQPLTATSCKVKMLDPSPTSEDAIDQLRVMAARIGANALLNPTCEGDSGTSLIKNCWSSLTCHGAAIILR